MTAPEPTEAQRERAREMAANWSLALEQPTQKAIRDLEDEIAQALAEADAAGYERGRAEGWEAAKNECAAILLGWRENDWPEGISRRTAEIMAQHFAARFRARQETDT